MLAAPLLSLRWLQNLVLGPFRRILLAILASGPVPNHIAFVMDGNRRYAKRLGKPSHEGHFAGFSTLCSILEICFHLRVHSVTVYAFSIENFKRSPDEVDALMNLCEEKLNELCQHGSLLEQHGVRLNVLGKTSLLPQHVRDAVKRAESRTRNHNKAILNVMMPYTSREEITTAVESTVRQTLYLNKNPDDVTEDDIDSQLYTTLGGNGPVDILIRTSGVNRLSDFLTWQCSENTQIHFTPTYWPDLGLRDFVPILLDYQRKVWSRKFILAP